MSGFGCHRLAPDIVLNGTSLCAPGAGVSGRIREQRKILSDYDKKYDWDWLKLAGNS